MEIRDKLNSYDKDVLVIINKRPGMTAGQIQQGFYSKRRVSHSLRRLKELGLIAYDIHFRFYPVCQVVS